MSRIILDCKTIKQADIDNISNKMDRELLQRTINMIQNNDVNKKALFLEYGFYKDSKTHYINVRDSDTGKYVIIDNRAHCVRFSKNKYSKNKVDLLDFLEDTKLF